jgi:hypothetical protein
VQIRVALFLLVAGKQDKHYELILLSYNPLKVQGHSGEGELEAQAPAAGVITPLPAWLYIRKV